jgi:hypothetical protein
LCKIAQASKNSNSNAQHFLFGFANTFMISLHALCTPRCLYLKLALNRRGEGSKQGRKGQSSLTQMMPNLNTLHTHTTNALTLPPRLLSLSLSLSHLTGQSSNRESAFLFSPLLPCPALLPSLVPFLPFSPSILSTLVPLYLYSGKLCRTCVKHLRILHLLFLPYLLTS